MTKNFDALTDIACLNIHFHLFRADESRVFFLNQIQSFLNLKVF